MDRFNQFSPQTRTIAASNNPLSLIGPLYNTLDEQNMIPKDQVIDFIKNIRKQNNQPNAQVNVGEIVGAEGKKGGISIFQNMLNAINNSPVNVSTSGVGIEQTFNPGGRFSADIFANQPFGGQFQYGAGVNFNIPLGR
tara:strand:+ start:120 stop:533 length:414 start_codon:yes stop_codon:yes gene_type:complete